jgi:hypothetical protein
VSRQGPPLGVNRETGAFIGHIGYPGKLFNTFTDIAPQVTKQKHPGRLGSTQLLRSESSDSYDSRFEIRFEPFSSNTNNALIRFDSTFIRLLFDFNKVELNKTRIESAGEKH